MEVKTMYERTMSKALGKNAMAKSLAYFVFREIIEDVHVKYNISQKEMKSMNKKAVNRAAAFLECMGDEEVIGSLVALLSLETTGWDNPKETDDTKGFIALAKESAEQLRSIKGKTNDEIYSRIQNGGMTT